MPEWKLQQDRDALIGAALVFARDVEHHILPAIPPIVGQTCRDTLRTLGQKPEFYIRPLMDNLPGFIPPWIRFFQKKVAVHTDPNHFTAFDLVLSAAILAERIAEARLRTVNIGPVFAAFGVVIVHVAVLAALAAFDTAVPGIPYIMQNASPHSVSAFLRVPFPGTGIVPYPLLKSSTQSFCT